MPVKIGRTVFEHETIVKKIVPEDVHEENSLKKSVRLCDKCSPHQRSKSKISNIDLAQI
jgi:hypothetical protein